MDLLSGAYRLPGFDIDIWNEVSRDIGVDSTFRVMPFGDLLEAVKNGEVDAGMAGISITQEREVALDFSYPYMNSGLRILTAVDDDPTLFRVLKSSVTEDEFGALADLVAFVFSAHTSCFSQSAGVRASASATSRAFWRRAGASWRRLRPLATAT